MGINYNVVNGLIGGIGVEDVALQSGVSVDAVRAVVIALRDCGAMGAIVAARMLRGNAAIVTVNCPWPHKSLTPNAKRKKHWSAYSDISNKYRGQCHLLTRAEIGRMVFARPPRISIAFFPPDNRRRDDDGMIGAFKAGRDGIADAIRHDDHTWRPEYSFRDPIPPAGAVIVSIMSRDGEVTPCGAD